MEIIKNLPHLPPRAADSNKGTFGRVLIVAGSRGMAGAAVLAGRSALRGGAGLVRIALPTSILDTVAAGHSCYMTVPLPADEEGRLTAEALTPLLALAQANDVVAMGPGLGRSPHLDALVTEFIKTSSIRLVLDADGLNALASQPGRAHAGPVVITPHPGEFARLVGLTTAEVQKRRLDLASAFALQHDLVVVLKGHGTVVTDGRRAYVNDTGNPGMATAGSGDVLTGLLAALVGQHLEPFDAAILAVHLHGRAGDLARDKWGEICLTAVDLIECLPGAFAEASRSPPGRG